MCVCVYILHTCECMYYSTLLSIHSQRYWSSIIKRTRLLFSRALEKDKQPKALGAINRSGKPTSFLTIHKVRKEQG